MKTALLILTLFLIVSANNLYNVKYSSNTILLNTNRTGVVAINIYDINGKVIYSNHLFIKSGTNQFELKELQKSDKLLIVEINDGTKIEQFQVIKK